jgi:ferredoxin
MHDPSLLSIIHDVLLFISSLGLNERIRGIPMEQPQPQTTRQGPPSAPASVPSDGETNQGRLGRIRMVVDLNRCQGYAQCCFLAPNAFRLLGEEALMYDPAPDDAQREHILRAAAACPVQAILIEQVSHQDSYDGRIAS